ITDPVYLHPQIQMIFTGGQLLVYPNPFTNRLFIQLELARDEKIDLRLYTVNGTLAGQIPAKVYSKGQHIIDWTGESKMYRPFVPGVYLLHVISDSQNKIIKIIKK
ncbi:MAG TPA: T9SS type A sorting domain-containing protein, partial [Bacteroidales bacterium]|nr:T9SS type A sorting domain-containing protein [Bacteroidales bacterium]